MVINALIDHLSDRLRQPLPAQAAHDQMKATPIGTFRPKFEHDTPARPGSVLILLYPHQGKIWFPLTLRRDYAGAHSGQVSLPGGKQEPGETEVDTALRECEEEIGVPRGDVQVIGRLSNFFVIPSNFLVTPVVGFCKARPQYRPDPVEVARILEASLNDLLGNSAIKEKEILAAGRYPMRAPHFEVDGETVWGATAMMLNEFRSVLQDMS